MSVRQNKPGKQQGFSDLVPGIASAIAFIVMALLLGTGWLWLSAALGVATYFGVKWLLPSPQTVEDAPPPTAQEVLKQVRDLTPRVPEGSIQRKLAGICAQADRLLSYFAAHPANADDSLFVIRQYLEHTRLSAAAYLEATRAAPQAMQKSTQELYDLLDDVATRFAGLQERVAGEDDAALASELSVMKKTLQELDNVYLNIKGQDR